MQDSELTKLRRARSRVHRQLDKLEPLLAGYHAKLADLNARIQTLAPELNLPPRRYSPNEDVDTVSGWAFPIANREI